MMMKILQMIGWWCLVVTLTVVYYMAIVPLGLLLKPWSDRLRIRNNPGWQERPSLPPINQFARREY